MDKKSKANNGKYSMHKINKNIWAVHEFLTFAPCFVVNQIVGLCSSISFLYFLFIIGNIEEVERGGGGSVAKVRGIVFPS